MAAMVGRSLRRRLFQAAAVGLAVAMSSCAYFDAPPAAPPVTEPPPQPAVAALKPPAPPRPTRKPQPPPLLPPGGQSTESQPVDPERLIGLDQPAAESWLGAPNQRTDAAPGTIWRYLSKDCEVDVYFYLDLQKGVMRALTYDVRSDDIVERRSERCFQQLVDEHRQRESNAASIGPH